MNVEIETEAAQFPEKIIHKWDFRCSAVYNDVFVLYLIQVHIANVWFFPIHVLYTMGVGKQPGYTQSLYREEQSKKASRTINKNCR